MRDQETADTALKAGLTGHLVLSSLHTNSAIDTFLRLIDMGLDRFVVAGSVRTVVSQRLVRQLCAHCRMSVVPDAETRATLKLEGPHHVIYQHRGCPKCTETGYQGRTAIFEVIEVDDELADLVKSEKSSRADYKDFLARRQISSLRQAGLALVISGVTSLKEVLRVT
jgi:type II secretory ATPase GspE/PulE/Tfp pilus assembly ATPase PilB-like protein